ncbi:type VI secretion system-associated FHA domain protein [Arcobacter sp. CECT 8985]|uniref:type VI secretion system-associated FHA domain protein n=1 Tax=Arcobacter sp. CECT 8985 TaxID=1935424 RepID=UPI00100AEE22|nr:type VI secretion system-associated FHA domain protein [Arcobacter sp. CECT 8985]RXJ87623.1 hypothetical protein CRU93_03575 [Arcobacter sp. CECT 8985]
MKLILDIIKHPQEKILKRNFHFNKQNSNVGRDESLDNRLIDSKNIISSNHFNIHYKNNTYYIEDVSTNGTFLKHPFKRLVKNSLNEINESDIFIVGEYELQARYIKEEYSSFDNSDNEKEQLIPDDFLLDDNEIMNSSIYEEDNIYEEPSNSVLDMFEEDTKETVIETIYDEDEQSHDDILDNHIDVDTYKHEENKQVELDTKQNETSNFDITNILASKLGIEFEELSLEEKQKVTNEICDIVINSLEGLKHSLLIKEKITKDLKVDEHKLHINENPVKMGQLALNIIDINDNQKLNLSDAISKSFKELNTHNIALHRTSKNLVHIAANKFSPKNLEYYFEKNNEIKTLLPKKHQLWNCYINMFNNFDKDKTQAQNMIMDDFVDEYKNILYTIKLTSV